MLALSAPRPENAGHPRIPETMLVAPSRLAWCARFGLLRCLSRLFPKQERIARYFAHRPSPVDGITVMAADLIDPIWIIFFGYS